LVAALQYLNAATQYTKLRARAAMPIVAGVERTAK
jgi:hypothetical protein